MENFYSARLRFVRQVKFERMSLVPLLAPRHPRELEPRGSKEKRLEIWISKVALGLKYRSCRSSPQTASTCLSRPLFRFTHCHPAQNPRSKRENPTENERGERTTLSLLQVVVVGTKTHLRIVRCSLVAGDAERSV